jgi:hypothetical protein
MKSEGPEEVNAFGILAEEYQNDFLAVSGRGGRNIGEDLLQYFSFKRAVEEDHQGTDWNRESGGILAKGLHAARLPGAAPENSRIIHGDRMQVPGKLDPDDFFKSIGDSQK